MRHKSVALGALVVLALSMQTTLPASGARLTTATPTSAPCAPAVVDAAVPSWASAGFTPPDFRMHYELGRGRKIVALLWKYPLLSPPAQHVANKILWVSRLITNGSPLVITAERLLGTTIEGPVVRRTVAGGPGPSYVNLPSSGCWRLELSWSGHRDSLDLRYLAPSP